jgi:hypothetical protein
MEGDFEDEMEGDFEDEMKGDFEDEMMDDPGFEGDEMDVEEFGEEGESNYEALFEQAIESALENVDIIANQHSDNFDQEIWTSDWLIFSDDDIQRELEGLGYVFVEKHQLGAFGKTLATIQAPASFSMEKDYQLVLKQINQVTRFADLNHVYRHQSATGKKPVVIGSIPSDLLPMVSVSDGIQIGLIDTAINATHSALKNASIKQRSFVGIGKNEPTTHGTQIAGILVGSDTIYSGLLPQSKLLAASVFFNQSRQENIATTKALLQGLNWLAENDVKVINMSLSGPPNRLLEFAVNQLCQQNVVIVAAVGNSGPLSEPLYPAGYECTLAVTAVDDKKRIYKNAVIGQHVDMAAYGVDLMTLDSDGGYKDASGTSLATAFVSAFVANEYAMAKSSPDKLNDWLATIYQACSDLGTHGFDPVFGHGLLPTKAIENIGREQQLVKE